MPRTPDCNGNTQHPRDFTVKICHFITEEVIGTGFFVSRDGKIVTCKHVVRDASELGSVVDGVLVKVGFPQTKDPDSKIQLARVIGLFTDTDDDVVLLQLDSSILPVWVRPAILATAQESEGHKFVSFGFRRLGVFQGIPARGEITGYCDRPSDLVLQADPVTLTSKNIDHGMSGSAVLDQDRDRVVGVISMVWDSGGRFADSETSFAVDCAVLSLEPLHLLMEGIPLQPDHDIEYVVPQDSLAEEQKIFRANEENMARQKRLLDDAPLPPSEWVGRENLLQALDEAWLTPKYCIMGLIGFGGEGKTSLASRWLNHLLNHPSLPQPDGVFWWDFNKKPYADVFLNKVFEYLDIGQINPELLVSIDVKAEIIRSMKGRYLFILDGIETLQHQTGDDYGLLTNKELLSFLRSFATGNHQSFCLVTSRAPLIDLLDCRNYNEIEVSPLSIQEGRILLRKLGVQGSDSALEQVVKDWGGYALMLTLIGAYLKKRGDHVRRIREIPPPVVNEPLHERVQRILSCYDANLTEAESEILYVLSAFRLPVPLGEPRFNKAIFEGETGAPQIPKRRRYVWLDRWIESVQRWLDRLRRRKLSESPRLDRKLEARVGTLVYGVFRAMITRLIKTRILREYIHSPKSSYDQTIAYYNVHPLIRSHYSDNFQRLYSDWFQQTHRRIADYYLQISGQLPQNPRREDIAYTVEIVYHLCQAKDFDRAWDILTDKLTGKKANYLLIDRLAAWDIFFELNLEFFPNRDHTQEPQVNSAASKASILNNVALSSRHIAIVTDPIKLYNRAISKRIEVGEGREIGKTISNLVYLYSDCGDLETATASIQEAIYYLSQSTDEPGYKWEKHRLLSIQAWVNFLTGDVKLADEAFQISEKLFREIEPSLRHLNSLRGIHHADYLRRMGRSDEARQVITENLKTSKKNSWLPYIGCCYRCLGDLSVDEDQHKVAEQHYQNALQILRNTTDSVYLTETLSARGRWAAKYMFDVDTAQVDLSTAIDYALSTGARRYEADIRVGLAWMHLAAGNSQNARSEAERAWEMSKEMGYHWGQVDAMELLERLKN